jgi:hypothetical protein
VRKNFASARLYLIVLKIKNRQRLLKKRGGFLLARAILPAIFQPLLSRTGKPVTVNYSYKARRLSLH